MRITEQQQKAIKEIVFDLDPAAMIYLFGSRVDDTQRGGDIDLLIISQIITEHHRRQLRLNLFERIGEQKIDLIFTRDLSQPFVRIAYNQGKLL